MSWVARVAALGLGAAHRSAKLVCMRRAPCAMAAAALPIRPEGLEASARSACSRSLEPAGVLSRCSPMCRACGQQQHPVDAAQLMEVRTLQGMHAQMLGAVNQNCRFLHSSLGLSDTLTLARASIAPLPASRPTPATARPATVAPPTAIAPAATAAPARSVELYARWQEVTGRVLQSMKADEVCA